MFIGAKGFWLPLVGQMSGTPYVVAKRLTVSRSGNPVVRRHLFGKCLIQCNLSQSPGEVKNQDTWTDFGYARLRPQAKVGTWPSQDAGALIQLNGLEFDHVVIPKTTYFLWERQAQAKLFYVAISRAT